ncbi:PQQ-dependent sugar dehydrogenase [Alteribacter aurantiacus]|uniref:PQQ-dependent sugar dehydrogenase n=1 Tax=Alteribacter aurantiacus TaxID=254410 RepID=UPI000420BD63|nr:sorbosone dehydrogenase family protein [Alteribacter aurantiacus]
MKKGIITMSLLAVLISGCGADEATEEDAVEETEDGVSETDEGTADSSESSLEDKEIEVETVATELDVPWDISYLDGTFYITERGGAIAQISTDGNVERMEVNTSSPIWAEGEGGLLGFVLGENFHESEDAFLYYTYEGDGGGIFNRVVKVNKDDGEWNEVDIIIDNIPGDGIHNGGRMAIGEDGYLYVTTGDANVVELSQDEESLAGKILRVSTDGEVPDDNPREDSYVYSSGHRNPQGLAWIGETLYSSEHGPVAHDEINIIKGGKNYGWPIIKGDEEANGMETPIVHSGEETWAPSGITNWQDTLIIAGLRGERVYWLDDEENELQVLFEGEGRIRDVFAQGESLYLITNNTDGRGNPSSEDDRLIKLTLE